MILTIEVANRIIDRMEGETDQDISVTDPGSQIIASTDPQLIGTYHPLASKAITAGQTVESSGELASGLALALTYGEDILGAIVLHEDPDRGRGTARLLKTLSDLVVHLVAVIGQLPEEKRLKNTFLTRLLRGEIKDKRAIPDQAAVFGIDLEEPRVVVAVGVVEAFEKLISRWRNESLPDAVRAHRLDGIQNKLLSSATQILGPELKGNGGFVEDRWMVLLPRVDRDSVDAERERIASQMQQLLDALSSRLGTQLSAGVGRYYPEWEDLCRSFTDASLAANLGMRLRGGGRAYLMEELGLARFLAERGEVAKQELAERVLHVLDKEPEIMDTLGSYFRNNLSSSVTARELYIHRHTLLYRLNKVEQLTELSPRRFDDAVQLYAAMLIRKIGLS